MGKTFDEFLATIDQEAVTEEVIKAVKKSLDDLKRIDEAEGTASSAQDAATFVAVRAGAKVCLYYLRVYHEWTQS